MSVERWSVQRSINLIYPVLDSDGGQQVAEVSDIASDNDVTTCQSHRGDDDVGVSFLRAMLLAHFNKFIDRKLIEIQDAEGAQ